MENRVKNCVWPQLVFSPLLNLTLKIWIQFLWLIVNVVCLSLAGGLKGLNGRMLPIPFHQGTSYHRCCNWAVRWDYNRPQYNRVLNQFDKQPQCICLNACLSENVWNSRNNPRLLAYTIKSHSSTAAGPGRQRQSAEEPAPHSSVPVPI